MNKTSMFLSMATLVLAEFASFQGADAAPSSDFAARCSALKGMIVEGGTVTLAEPT
ncbi:hypothetical protein [Agrobacterium vitis]|uniref:hypothetical protein n=1 Tax=Agrobacterium vitis TaxID=373 RepID=UPI001574941E|nr:hypothetical protein [Agrobacterium vitis]NSZ19894.1 hypothetical protein [Agrobacterium vitis]QZO07588.1 hypothetical protein K4831_25420 [Agrobacterium vitis]UJL90782.1 hypothetical protein AVF2S5_22435 [Agrobacterium vitis]